MRVSRFRPGALLPALLLILSATAARAQPGSGGPGSASTDSLGRPIFGFLRPTYSSSYNVTQQETAWDQRFEFRNNFGKFSLDSSTNYVVNTDPKRANYRRTGGTTVNRLDYTFLNRVPISAQVLYDRKGTDDAGTLLRQDSFEGGLSLTYRRKFFRGFSMDLKGGLSGTRRTDTADLQGEKSGGRENGLKRETTLTVRYDGPFPGMSFNANTSATNDRTESKAIGTAAGTTSGKGAGPKDNSNTAHQVTWSYVPADNWLEGFEANASYNKRDLRDSYILVSRDTTLNNRQETQVNANENMAAGLRYKPGKSATTELAADFSTSTSRVDRAVERERSSDRSSRGMKFKARHMIRGNQLESNLDISRDEDRSPLRPASETLNRNLNGIVNRTFSDAANMRVLGEVGLRSLRYDDGELDQDNQKMRVEGLLALKPIRKILENGSSMPRLETNLTGRIGRDRAVSVSSTQSRATRMEESFGLSADIKYTLSSRTRISQLYDFRALFTSFRFNAPSDNIQRTRDIRTTISHSLSPRTILDLSHGFRYRETGGYRRDAAGARVFIKANDRYDQDLKVAVNYQATPWLSFRTEQWLHRDDDITLSDRSRNTNSRIEFNQTTNLSRPIPGGGEITANGGLQVRKVVKPRVGETETFFNAMISLKKPF